MSEQDGLIEGAVGEILSGSARGCAPWIPPVFTTPAVARELDEASVSSTGSVFGVARVPGRAAGGGVLEGIKVSRKKDSWTKNGAKYVSSSGNTKIGALDATWASIHSTCVDCSWKKTKVCYALGGRAQFVVYKLDEAARRARRGATETSFDEAACIDAAYHVGNPCETGAVPPGTVLRVHASGDTSTVKGARALAAAIARWKKRGGSLAYSYTHAWRRVPRAAFGELSVLASIDKAEDVPAALAQGYGSVTVLVTEDSWAKNFTIRPDGDLVFKKFPVPGTNTNLGFVPCPAQYPVDAASHREAAKWKALLVGRAIGLFQPPAPGKIDSAAARRLRTAGIKQAYAIFVPVRGDAYECGPEPLTHLPAVREQLPVYTPKQKRLQEELSARIVAAGFPAPSTDAFRRMMRRIHPGEKSTCQACALCFDDQALGKKGQAVAFRPDFSGGILKTDALLRKRDAQAVIAEATAR